MHMPLGMPKVSLEIHIWGIKKKKNTTQYVPLGRSIYNKIK